MSEHKLTGKRFDATTARKAVCKLLTLGHDLWRAECSCGRWRIEVGLKSDIEQLHLQHQRENLSNLSTPSLPE